VWAQATGARDRALLLAARGDLPAALVAVEESLGAHGSLDMPFDCARALLVKGAIERRAGRRSRAKSSLERARSEFERLGTPLWAERARAEMSRLGLRRSAGSELTTSERRVAELAATGLTNRDVAAALFVSPKTVEANLARVYRKLGIRSRAELGARMNDTAQT
jgi:DNA-binding NarL/FixJ family response regulator